MVFAAFFMEPEKGAFALSIVVCHFHRNSGTDPGKAIDHKPDQGAVAQAHEGSSVDGVKQIAGLLSGEHGGLAGFDHMLRAAHRACGVKGDDLADDQPIEEHPDGR